MTQLVDPPPQPVSTAAPAVDADALVAGVQQLLASSQKLRQSIVQEHTAEAQQATAATALDAAAAATKAAQGMVLESVADVQASELAVLSIIQPPPAPILPSV